MVNQKAFDKPTTRNRNKNRVAIGLSIAFHVGLLAVLVFIYVPRRELANGEASAKESSHRAVSQPRNKTEADAKQADASKAIKESVRAHIETAASKPSAEALAELDKKVRQLDQYVDDRTVDETANVVANSLGIERNQYQPKSAPIPGILDPNTAQILKIVQAHGETKGAAYIATMIDAEGHQAKVPMSESEGKVAYDAFQKMKNFPAVEGLYRQIVMPLLQKMVSSPKQAEASK